MTPILLENFFGKFFGSKVSRIVLRHDITNNLESKI